MPVRVSPQPQAEESDANAHAKESIYDVREDPEDDGVGIGRRVRTPGASDNKYGEEPVKEEGTEWRFI